MDNELITKARKAKSVEELLALAGENGLEMTEKAAKVLYDNLHSSEEMADDELESVSGGGFCSTVSDGFNYITDSISDFFSSDDDDIKKTSAAGGIATCRKCGNQSLVVNPAGKNVYQVFCVVCAYSDTLKFPS